MRLNDDSTLLDVVSLAPAPVALFGPDRVCRAVSDTLAATLGRRREHLIGRPLADLVIDVDQANAALGGGPVLLRLRGCAGEPCWVDWRATETADGGLLCSVIEAVADTAQPAQLTSTQVQLLEAERLAVLGSLAGGVANQIGNALTSTRLGLARLVSFELAQLPRDAVGQHRLELLQEAREGVDRVQHVTDALRAFARLEDAAPAPVDLRAAVAAVVRIAAHEIEHRARLHCDLEPAPAVLAPEPALRHLVLHLILNAAQSVEGLSPGQAVVNVSVFAEDGKAVLEVSDNGAGIAPGDLERIFDPFFTTRPPGQGLGLGLSVCRDLVDRMQGQISAHSEVGKGTRMRVALPPAPAAATIDRRPAPVAPSLSRRRILIIDDDRPVASAIALELADHDIMVAGSGREALEILRRDPGFDVVLCDLMMPELSGADVYDWLKRVEPQLVDRFVFMTGGAFTTRAREFLAGIKNPRLDKPFDPSELRAVIERIAPRPRDWRTPDGAETVRRARTQH